MLHKIKKGELTFKYQKAKFKLKIFTSKVFKASDRLTKNLNLLEHHKNLLVNKAI